MNLIRLAIANQAEKEQLNQIFEETKPHFQRVEGRDPLPPLIDIQTVIPGIPPEKCHCLSIYYLKQIIGYLWVFEDSPTNFYLFHFAIREKYRGLGLAGLAMNELEKNYGQKNYQTAELFVSGANYLGLKFWTTLGFTKILNVYPPEDLGTASVELELQKQLAPSSVDHVHLLPVTEANAFLGATLQATSEQIDAELILSVPDALKAAAEIPFAQAYFIRLNNTVIGYTALVFDETIPEPDKRYWLWQLMIDKNYQNKGYAAKALALIEQQFKKAGVPVITLSTKPDNANALHLYQRFGFQATGEQNDAEIILQKYLE